MKNYTIEMVECNSLRRQGIGEGLGEIPGPMDLNHKMIIKKFFKAINFNLNHTLKNLLANQVLISQ